jgi:hypothetical protein
VSCTPGATGKQDPLPPGVKEDAIIGAVKTFTVTIEGLNWKDIQDMELPDLPKEGDTIETRYGTCVVTEAELLPDRGGRAGKIVCRFAEA